MYYVKKIMFRCKIRHFIFWGGGLFSNSVGEESVKKVAQRFQDALRGAIGDFEPLVRSKYVNPEVPDVL